MQSIYVPNNKPLTKASYDFLKQYCEEKCVSELWDLFDKKQLTAYVNLADWDWSVNDEMKENGLTEDAAIAATEKWFLSMSNEELFERISGNGQWELIRLKAEELGFEQDMER